MTNYEKYKSESHVGSLGWAVIVAGVTAWDILADETLTNAFARGRENPKTRYLVIGAWAITTAHLMDWLPEKIDPIDQLAQRTRRLIDGLQEM